MVDIQTYNSSSEATTLHAAMVKCLTLKSYMLYRKKWEYRKFLVVFYIFILIGNKKAEFVETNDRIREVIPFKFLLQKHNVDIRKSHNHIESMSVFVRSSSW